RHPRVLRRPRLGDRRRVRRGGEVRSLRRPRPAAAFKAMLEAAEARQVDAVLVHKLDRFARNLLVLLTSLNRLGRADVSFVSVTEQIDYSTPQGRLFLIMLGALAEWYSNNLSEETGKGKRERTRQGLHNGQVPFGMVAGPAGVAVADARPLRVDGDRRPRT